MSLFIYFFVGLSLSVDAFSIALALSASTGGKVNYLLPITVGIFHFIMPIIGSYISLLFINILLDKANTIIAIVFLILALEIYHSKDTQKSLIIDNILTIIIISVTVSLDSLLVGLALSLKEINIYVMSFIFSLVSSTLTVIGINIGVKLKNRHHNLANYVGIGILVVLAIKYFVS